MQLSRKLGSKEVIHQKNSSTIHERHTNVNLRKLLFEYRKGEHTARELEQL